jgi:hypothetical protein
MHASCLDVRSIAPAGQFSNDNMQVRAPSLVLAMSTKFEPGAYVHPCFHIT